MSNASRFVDADSPQVRDILVATTDIVLAAGGSVHPQACMVERDGSMTVICPGGSSDQPLFDLPRHLLVPIEGAQWESRSDSLVLVSPAEGLLAVQRDLLDLHVALFNATGKVPWAVRCLPTLALGEEQQGVRDAVAALRPRFGRTADVPLDERAPGAFLSTRVFGLPIGGDHTQGVLMTLIDLLNHHNRGAGLNVDDRAMTISLKQPTGTDECFVRYGGRRDALDLAISYGFLAEQVTFARCAPLVAEVPVLGRVEVRGIPALPANPLDPPSVTRTDDGIALSHLTFEQARPDRWRQLAYLALYSAALAQGGGSQSTQAANAALDAIAAEQVKRLDNLVDACGSCDSPNEVVRMLEAAAQSQLVVIEACR